IYVIGGWINLGWPDNTSINTVEVYDPAADTWAFAPSMPTARANIAAAGLNGIVYVVDGYRVNTPAGALGTTESFDTGSGTWSTLANDWVARGGATAQTLNGSIWAMGGYNGRWLTTVNSYLP